MAAQRHIHKYARSKLNRGIYYCIFSDCTHYLNKAFLLDKIAICNGCNSMFKLNKQQLKNARPVCNNCSKSTQAKRQREIQAELEKQLALQL